MAIDDLHEGKDGSFACVYVRVLFLVVNENKFNLVSVCVTVCGDQGR